MAEQENITLAEDQPRLFRQTDFGDGPATLKDKIQCFIGLTWKIFVCVLTPIFAIVVLLPFPPQKHQWCGYTLVVMAVYWMTECIPLPVTSFLPVFIFPVTGVMDTETTCACYFNDMIMMFLGSLMLAAAVEQSGLHKRLALFAIRHVGYSHYKLLFAMCFITMFVSMWITNTAATTMMVPITFALLKVFEDQKLLTTYDVTPAGLRVASDFTTCYFCSVAYSATVGGIGTMVGTATNLVFKGLWEKQYPDSPEYLSFPLFSAFAIPYMLVMELFVYLSMIFLYFGWLRPNSENAKRALIPPEGIKAAEAAVLADTEKLGSMSYWEINVAVLFSVCMVMFFCRSPQIFTGWGDVIVNYFKLDKKKFVKDSVCAMMFVFMMFLLPRSLDIFKNFTAKTYGELPRGKQKSVLDFHLMDNSLPYSFAFLLGGGFALSTAAKEEYSNLNGKIGEALTAVGGLPNTIIILIFILMTVFLTNFASNVAICNVVTPIAMTLAEKINKHPLLYNIVTGFSASYCYCLPVGTPGNLIVQSAAKIQTSKIIIAGLAPTFFTVMISWFFMMVYAPVVWPDLRNMTRPHWINTSGHTLMNYRRKY